MIEFLIKLDTQLFLFLNEIHNPFWDELMYWISYKYTWIPLYAFFLILIIKHYKWKSLYIIVAVALLITLSDQISVKVFKFGFERLRPCHNPNLEGLVHIVKGHCGGKYGFVSSHAANTFALAMFLSLLFKSFYKYSTLLLLFWAAIVSYSRIYLGVHYPADILGGALLGILLGYLVFYTLKWVEKQFIK